MPAQANTSRKCDAAASAAQPAAARASPPLAAPLLLPKAAATGSQLRQPHNRTAAAGSSRHLANINTCWVPCFVRYKTDG